MSISFEFEKIQDVPLKCFHCEHMKAKLGYKRVTYQCEHDRCKIDEEKKEKKSEGSDSTDGN